MEITLKKVGNVSAEITVKMEKADYAANVKTALKKFNTNATAEMLSSASAAVDKAAAKGVISKNAANRQKARMARVLAKAE